MRRLIHMDKNSLMEMIDSVVSELNVEDKAPRKDSRPCTYWLPLGYKERYDILQAVSNKQFGTLLKKMNCEVIDRAFERAGLKDKAS